MKYYLQEKFPNDASQPILIHITSPECIIGRKSVVELRKRFMVSRLHAMFNVTNRGTLCVKDLDSKFGLFVNGQIANKNLLYQLDIGNTIGFGTLDSSQGQGFVCTVCCDQPVYNVKRERISFDEDHFSGKTSFKYSLEKKIKPEKLLELDCATQKVDSLRSIVPYTVFNLDASEVEKNKSVTSNFVTDVAPSAETDSTDGEMCQTALKQPIISEGCSQETHLPEDISNEPIHSETHLPALCDGRQNDVDDTSFVASSEVQCAMSVQLSAFIEKPVTCFKEKNANQQHRREVSNGTAAFEKDHPCATKDQSFQNQNLPPVSEADSLNAWDSSENCTNAQSFGSQEPEPFHASVISEPDSQVDPGDIAEHSEKCNAEVCKSPDTFSKIFTCRVLLKRHDLTDSNYVCNERDSEEVSAMKDKPQKKRRKIKSLFTPRKKRDRSRVASNCDDSGNGNTLSQTMSKTKPCYVALTKLDSKHFVIPSKRKRNSKGSRKNNATHSSHQKSSKSKKGKKSTK